jgi:EAL domain-containing protein (putative c-di-GMP-specific phosphodiesterase class I)/GGDEF domain-containing protein
MSFRLPLSYSVREWLHGLLQRVIGSFIAPSRRSRILAILVVALSLLASAWLVHSTGGVKYAALHILYLPIILSALVFGASGGVLAGAVGGLLIGPLMPLDVLTGEPQNLANWLYRVAFFCLIGGFVGIGVGILRQQLAILDWLTEHDARTGLLDRRGLLKALEGMIGQDGAWRRPFLVVTQLNNFLDFQNTFGSAFAEELLKQICARGRSLLPPEVPMAVIQPDRLAIIFESNAVAHRLLAETETQIRAPYMIDGVPVHVDFAIGAAEFYTHARTAEELLQKASIAMHTAATRMRPFYLYESSTDLTSRDNLILLGRIPAALSDNEFVIWHQAKVSLATGQVCGTEALLRWQLPHRGLVMPSDFIAQAEESVLINNLTHWVIKAALADVASWNAQGYALSVAINLSVRNLHNQALFETLDETVHQHAIDPRLVELEITESAVMDDFDYCAHLVSRLRERGYHVAIDDFGTGHSSLAYLKNLPVSAIKIDQSFVKNLLHDASDQKIVRTILGLAKALNLETVAEGIEDAGALALLRDWGCDFGQGFYIHRPTPYADFLTWMEGQRPRMSA